MAAPPPVPPPQPQPLPAVPARPAGQPPPPSHPWTQQPPQQSVWAQPVAPSPPVQPRPIPPWATAPPPGQPRPPQHLPPPVQPRVSPPLQRWPPPQPARPPLGGPPVPEEPALPQPRWGLPDAAVSLVAAFVLGNAAALGTVLLGFDGTGAVLLSLLIGWLGLAGWPIVVSKLKGNGPRRDFSLGITWTDVGLGALGAVAMLVFAMVYVVVLVLLGFDVPTAAVGDIAEQADGAWLPVLAVMIAFGAPLVEELHFRGMWWAALCKRGINPWITMTITAVLFATFHFEPARYLLLLASGVVLGVLRLITGRIGASVVAHMLNNSLGALGLLALG
jgi:uncharacterized protein